jgi:hypothetical protein
LQKRRLNYIPSSRRSHTPFKFAFPEAFLGMGGKQRFYYVANVLRCGQTSRAHDGRNGDSDPLFSEALSVGARAGGESATQTQKAGDFLPFGSLRSAKARCPFIGRVAQHRPNSVLSQGDFLWRVGMPWALSQGTITPMLQPSTVWRRHTWRSTRVSSSITS